jgi:hypothetical protein
MNDALDTALHSYRFWRDKGNDILIAALLAEFLIEAPWTEHPNWWPWNRNKTKRALRSWRLKHVLRDLALSRKRAMVAAAFIVFFGVAVERIWGNWADDKADEIRFKLETELLEVGPRTQLLYGQPRADFVARMKRFKGQNVETRYCRQYMDSPINEEAMSVAMLLPVRLKEAGWNAPFAAPLDCGGQGITVTVGSKASTRTHAVAEALRFAIGKIPLFVDDKVGDVKAMGVPEPNNPNSVVLLVFAHPLFLREMQGTR